MGFDVEFPAIRVASERLRNADDETRRFGAEMSNTYLEDSIGKGAASTTFETAGRALTPITSGVAQVIEDTSNPDNSVAERVGRGFGKAVVGGPAMAAGSVAGDLAALAGGAVGGPFAPLTGTAAGLAAGTATTVGVSAVMNKLPIKDDVVDASGEIFDSLGEQIPTG